MNIFFRFYLIVAWLYVFTAKVDGTCADGGDSILVGGDVICNHDEDFIFHSKKEDPNSFEECQELCSKKIDCRYFSYGSQDVIEESFEGACRGCGLDAEFKHKNGFDTYEICEDVTPVVTRASDVSDEVLENDGLLEVDESEESKEGEEDFISDLLDVISDLLDVYESDEGKEEDAHEDLFMDEDNLLIESVKSRIVGGTSILGDYSFMVSFHQGNFDSKVICGGSLIAPNLVLSAAHCPFSSAYKYALIGSIFPTGSAVTIQTEHIIEASVLKRIKHPMYDTDQKTFDISILVLDQDIDTDLYVPIKLNFENDEPRADDILTVIGFGDTEYRGTRRENILQKVQVPVVSHSMCVEQYGERIKKEVQICAGYAEGGRDACGGDSGGPLFKEINGIKTQVGVVSYARGCAWANYSGIYARISGMSDWLKKTICLEGHSTTSFSFPFCKTPTIPDTITPLVQASDSVQD